MCSHYEILPLTKTMFRSGPNSKMAIFSLTLTTTPIIDMKIGVAILLYQPIHGDYHFVVPWREWGVPACCILLDKHGYDCGSWYMNQTEVL